MAVPTLSRWASVRLPWSCFQPPSLKFRTLGFPQYGFKLQPPRGSARSLPNLAPGLSLILPSPSSRVVGSCLQNRCGLDAVSASMCGARRKAVPTGPRGPRSGRVVLSPPSTLGDLIRRSGSLRIPSQHGLVIEPVFDIQGSSCLVARPSELRLSGSVRIAAVNFRRGPGGCVFPLLPHRHWPSGRG